MQYVTANVTETVCDHWGLPWFYPKLIASSTANVTLSVNKDRVFTKLFGSGQPRPLPLLTYGCFGARDSLTILASFNLPRMPLPSAPALAPALPVRCHPALPCPLLTSPHVP